MQTMKKEIIKLNFSKRGGLLPVVTQDIKNGDVLMVAYINQEAYDQTLRTGLATYYSTSRNKIWVKGEISGNVQIVREIFIDCDEDAILYKVEQLGIGACHTGERTCFSRQVKRF